MNNYKVYALVSSHEPNNFRYIGITKQSLNTRLYKHLYVSKFLKTHKDCWIQKHIKLGNNILMILIETVFTEECAKDREKYYIKHYKEIGQKLTNATDGGDGLNNPTEETLRKLRGRIPHNKGKKHSMEARIKMSQAGKGRKFSKEHKQKIRESNLNKQFSEEHKNNLSNAKLKYHNERKMNGIDNWNKGRKSSLETRKKLSNINLGKKMSEESKLKMRESARKNSEERKLKGIPHPNKGKKRSEETKLKLSIAGKNRKLTEEHKRKIRESHIGKKHTKETIEKIKLTKRNKLPRNRLENILFG